MRLVFVDSFFLLALLNERDATHAGALSWNASYSGNFLTTAWILVELGDGLSASRQRHLFPPFCRRFRADPKVEVVGWNEDLFDQGLALYEARPDKNWSLTDCLSFVVMQQAGISEALTADHHFEQAGFHAVFRQ